MLAIVARRVGDLTTGKLYNPKTCLSPKMYSSPHTTQIKFVVPQHHCTAPVENHFFTLSQRSKRYYLNVNRSALTIRERPRGSHSFRCRPSRRSWTRYRSGNRTPWAYLPSRCSTSCSRQGARVGWMIRRKPTARRRQGSWIRSLLLHTVRTP